MTKIFHNKKMNVSLNIKRYREHGNYRSDIIMTIPTEINQRLGNAGENWALRETFDDRKEVSLSIVGQERNGTERKEKELISRLMLFYNEKDEWTEEINIVIFSPK